MSYSKDFRWKVFSIKEKEGLSDDQTANRFDIGKTTLVRWRKRFEPARSRNKAANKINMEVLSNDIKEYPDAYNYERAKRLAVSTHGIWKAIKRLNITYKKTLNHPKAKEEERLSFQNKITEYKNEGKAIVYLDESGFMHDMPRTHGYSIKWERCFGKQDWGAKGRTNAIGALLDNVLLTVSLFGHNIDSQIFSQWIKEDLIPKLLNDSVIVLDNAAFHKNKDMQYYIKNSGYILEYLPTYSPDLNPIEHKWAQAKSIRRKYQCDLDQLFRDYCPQPLY